ncbi:hypothetical protein GCM10010404_13850 [Nonomuraea africana]
MRGSDQPRDGQPDGRGTQALARDGEVGDEGGDGRDHACGSFRARGGAALGVQDRAVADESALHEGSAYIDRDNTLHPPILPRNPGFETGNRVGGAARPCGRWS